MIVVGILVDSCQPPHLGVKQAYDFVVKTRGQQYTYVVATERKSDSNSGISDPLSASDKKQLLIRHGVPSDKVIDAKTYFDTSAIEKIYDPSDTAIVFYFFSDKGDVGYANDKVIPWDESRKESLKPLTEAVYYALLPSNLKRVRGSAPFTTKLFVDELGDPSNSDDNKKTFFALAFGWYDAGFFNLMKERFGKAFEKFSSRYSSAIGKPTMEESIAELTSIMVEDLAGQIGDIFDDGNGEQESEPSPAQKAAEKKSDIETLRQKQRRLDLTKQQAKAEDRLNKDRIKQQTKDVSTTKSSMASKSRSLE